MTKTAKSKELAKSMARLTNKVASLAVGKKNKKKSKNVNMPKLGVSSQMVQTSGRDIYIERSEVAFTVQLAAGTQASPTTSSHGTFNIVPDSFTHLKQMGKIFERIRWHKVNFRYVPAVGTTYGGLVAYGADWTRKNTGDTLGAISALTPNLSHSAWANGPRPLVLPKDRLMTKLWYNTSFDTADESPCQIDWFAQGAPNATASPVVIGYVYADYAVTLTGTSS